MTTDRLDFDYVNGNKVGNVGYVYAFSLERLIAEIEKCEVVCSNCHRHRTVARGPRNQT